MRILIADVWPNVQNALRVILEQQLGLEVVGEVADAGELVVHVLKDCPDIVLLGWELPGLQENNVLSILRLICPTLFIVVLSGRIDQKQRVLTAGADVFVSKVAPPERLISVIMSFRHNENVVQHSRMTRTASLESTEEDVDSRNVLSHSQNFKRSSIMLEVEKKQKNTLKYMAIIATAVVLLGCIAAGLAVLLVLINEIPFQHIFPH